MTPKQVLEMAKEVLVGGPEGVRTLSPDDS